MTGHDRVAIQAGLTNYIQQFFSEIIFYHARNSPLILAKDAQFEGNRNAVLPIRAGTSRQCLDDHGPRTQTSARHSKAHAELWFHDAILKFAARFAPTATPVLSVA